MPRAALPFGVRRFCKKVARRDLKLEKETGDRFTRGKVDMDELINELKDENPDAFNKLIALLIWVKVWEG